MAYEPTIWKDRAVENPRTYTIQENSDGTVTLVPAPGIIEDPGTPVNAANLNKLEQGLKTHEADNVLHGLIYGDDNIKYRAVISSDASLNQIKESSKYFSVIEAFVIDDNYIYVVGGTKVNKYDKHTLKLVSESVSYSVIKNISQDDSFLYISVGSNFYKLNKSNLSQVAQSAVMPTPTKLVVDDQFVYVWVRGDTRLRKFNKSDFSQVAETNPYDTINALKVDGDYVYVGTDTTTNSFRRINKSDMSTVAQSSVYNNKILGIATDAEHFYMGGVGGALIKVAKTNIETVIGSNTDLAGDILSISVNNGYVFASHKLAQSVSKLNKTDLVEVSQSKKYGGDINCVLAEEEIFYVGGAVTATIQKYSIEETYQLLGLRRAI